jgi:hypothetical protein
MLINQLAELIYQLIFLLNKFENVQVSDTTNVAACTTVRQQNYSNKSSLASN